MKAICSIEVEFPDVDMSTQAAREAAYADITAATEALSAAATNGLPTYTEGVTINVVSYSVLGATSFTY